MAEENDNVDDTSEYDVELPHGKQTRLTTPEGARKDLFRAYRRNKKSSNAEGRAGWRKKFSYLALRDFLVHARSACDDDKKPQTTCSSLNASKLEQQVEVICANDENYFVGEFYKDLKGNESIGFEGIREMDISPHTVSNEQTLGERSRSGVQFNEEAEVLVVPTRRFVREIPSRTTSMIEYDAVNNALTSGRNSVSGY